MRRPSPAMAVAMTALVLSAVGTAGASPTAMISRLIDGKSIKKGTVTARQIKKGTLTASLFKKGTLLTGPRGASGPKGDTGPAGPAGPTGPAGTPNGYTTTQADAAFLGKTAKANDADRWDGIDSSVLGTAVSVVGAAFIPTTGSTFNDIFPDFGVIEPASAGAAGHAPVYLPQGARVTGIRLGFKDDDNANDIRVHFSGTDAGGAGAGVFITATTTGAPDSASYQNLTVAPGSELVIDNTTHAYFLRVSFPGAASAERALAQVRISYAMPTA